MAEARLIRGAVVFAAVLAGCGPNVSQTEQVTRDFYKLIEAKDYPKIESLGAPEFQEASIRETWQSYVKDLTRLGKLASYEVVASSKATPIWGPVTVKTHAKYEWGERNESLTWLERDGKLQLMSAGVAP